MSGLIKGSLRSSWMNSPIPSLLLRLWQIEPLYKTIGMKICHLTFIRMKSSDFHVKRFAQTLVLQTATQTVEVKSALIPVSVAGSD